MTTSVPNSPKRSASKKQRRPVDGQPAMSPAQLAKLTVAQLEERDVPATTFTGTVFLDTNANGNFDSVAAALANVGSGTTTLTTETGWSGLTQPWDPVASRVPVTVRAFDLNNILQGQTTTNLDGTYTLAVTTGGSYRLEFSNLPNGISFGPSGQQTGTAVQLAAVVTNGNTGGINLGLLRAEDITPDNPILATSTYVFGAFDTPQTANLPTVESFPYNSGASIINPVTGTGSGTAGAYTSPDQHTIQIPHSQVGATWGLAYNRQTNQIYMAAFTKGHSGYGPGGPGAIYAAATTPTFPSTTVTTATQLLDLEALVPGSTGGNYRTQAAFTLPANTGGLNAYIRDGLYLDANGHQVGWDAVGKTGLGGLDADPTGRYLFTVALGDRKLYVIDTQNPTAAPTAVDLPVPNDAVTGVTGTLTRGRLGDLRPFAVQYYRGSIYVGAVNSAESTITVANPTGDQSRLRAYVFQFKLNTNANGSPTGTGQFVDLNGAASTTVPVLNIPLNYNRGYVQPGIANGADTFAPVSANWLPWSPVYKNLTNPDGPINNIGIYPQPEITGLAFGTDGNITIGLRDRAGDQFGVQTPSDVSNTSKLYTGITGGDTLRAFIDQKTTGSTVTSRWTLESNGAGPGGTPASVAGVGNGQGPGGGEFYAGDFLVPGINPVNQDHQEVSVGGVLQLPGYADAAVTSFDPAQLSQRYNAGGVRWYRNYATAADNQAGNAVRGYELYRSTVNFGVASDTFAKTNGIGDLIAVTPSPIEIGNRIWADLNRDGRQDPNEPGLGGVQVVLFKDSNAIATTTTDANGNYFFTSMVDPGIANRVLGKEYGVANLLPNMAYEVRIPLSQTALAALSLTTSNVNGNTEDQRDSDATAVAGSGVIPLTTGPNGTVNHTYDAGFQYQLEVGDFVWNDKNNDGIWQTGEQGLTGVTVQLLDSATNAVLAATTTNASGGYLFKGLNPGNYRVRIPLDVATNPGLQGYLSSTGTNGSATGVYEPANQVPVQQPNNQDSGVTQPGGFVLGPVVAATVGGAPLGETTTLNGDLGFPDSATNDPHSYRNQDFGFFQPVSIGDTVWVDRNNNGTRDAGEPGLAGVTVVLMEVTGTSATTVGTTVTNANGGYLFTNLAAGTYQVKLVRDAVLNGYKSSTGSLSNVGPFEPSLTDKPNDQDHGTEAVGFITGPILSATVGGATAVDPATIPAGLPADPAGVTSRYRTQDFGVFQPLQLGDFVWDDANNNGIKDPTENGIGGIVVELLDAAGNPITDSTNAPIQTTTLANGTYLFSNLIPGQYRIRITAPVGYMSSSGTNGSMTGPFEPGLAGSDLTNNADHGTQVAGTQKITSTAVTLVDASAATNPNPDLSSDGIAGRANLRQDFGIYRKVSVGDFVWNDINNDGIFNNAEPAIAGVTVRLLDGAGNPVLGAGGVAITTTTAADGGYLFTNLTPGRYQIEVVVPSGFKSSTGTNGSATGPFEPVLTPTDPANNRDHGTTQAGGLTVRGPVLNLQVGLAPLDDTDGPASATALDAGVPNENSYRNQDFGFYKPLAVGDLVWRDDNNNGIRDVGEPGIGGVTVMLLDGAGNMIAATTTATDGTYRFSDLAPGVYCVKVTAPTGLVSSTGGVGSPFEPAPQNTTDNIDKGTTQPNGSIKAGIFTLGIPGSALNPSENGFANLTQDFGLYSPLAVGDTVWLDANNNGIRDAGEAGVPNVVVRLLDGNGVVLATTTTNASGLYRFSNLTSGTYSVEITPPAGLTSSTGGIGSPFEPAAQSILEDHDKGTGQPNGTIRTQSFVLTPTGNPSENGTANLTQDFGLISPPAPPPPPPPPPPPAGVAQVSGFVYVDANLNGVRDAGEKPIPGTRVYLNGTDDNGNPVSKSVLTDTNGFYQFISLVPGNYTIREQQPDGNFYDGLDAAGTVGGTVVGITGNDILSSIRLNANDTGINYNFGEFPNAATFGYVWVDTNRNGIFEAGEAPIPGVAVTISGTAFAGTAFARPLTAADVPGGLTVLTNSQGRYDFPSLPYGTYTLSETQPTDYDDWQEQDGDPNGPRPTITNDVFSGLVLNASAPIRGPFNFGEVISGSSRPPGGSPQTPVEPSKRDFLSSTATSLAVATPGAVNVPITPPTPGVVSAVANLGLQPRFVASGLDPTKTSFLVTGAGAGSAPLVRVFDYASGLEKFRFLAYEQGYTGGVRTASGDINGDGVPDIITATGVGGGPRVRVFSGVDGSVLMDFFAMETTYTGGLSLAVGDVDGDGRADIIIGTDQGGAPRVKVISGKTGATISDFFAFDSNQRGGVRVAAADFNKDGRADIVAASGAGVPTRVRVFDSATAQAIQDFSPYGATFTGGAYVAAGDFNGDGVPDIITGAGEGGGPHVQVFSGLDNSVLASYFAYESTFTGGVRVASLEVTGDNRTEIVTAAGAGGGARVTIFSGPGISTIDDFFAFDATVTGGTFVGAGTATRKVLASTGLPTAAGNLGKPGSLPTL